MTAGLYAVSLAGVTRLQAAADAQLAADRAPAAGAVAQLKSTHDTMEDGLAKLAATYTKAASGYQAISTGIAGHEQVLGALQSQVQAAAGSVAGLSVPAFSLSPAPAPGATRASRPAAGAAVPSASAASGSAASVPAPIVAVPTPAPLPDIAVSVPAAAPPPPVHACTTASGKPC
jgi:hypothetical protein